MRKLLTLLIVAAVAATPSQRAAPDDSAEPSVTFQAGTKLVEVDVVAHDKRGPATGLTKDDFTLLDNGTPQDIAFFSVKSVRGLKPARPAQLAPPLPPGVISNRPDANEEPPATQTILLLDRLFTQPANQAYAIQRITRFLDMRRKQDGIGIYSLGNSLRVLQDVTDNDALLRRAAKSLKTANPNSGDSDTTGMTGHAAAEYTSFRERTPVLALRHALEAIARHLANVPGRKNLVWITQGFQLVTERDDFRPDMEAAARALNDANVALYAVDARGLIGALGEMTGIPNAESRGPSSQAQLIRAMRARALVPAGPSHIETMNMLAGLTGGDVYFNTNGLEDSFKRAVEDGDVTYSLSFYPSDSSQDGKVHRLRVKVARAGVSLRYRENYFATKAQAADEDRPTPERLFRDPLDATQLGLLARATPDQTRPGFFNVRVAVDLHGVQLANQDGKWVGAVDVSFHVEDSKSVQMITRMIEIPGDQLATALMRGITVDHSVQWSGKAGDLRVVVQDKASGAAGSLRIPLAGK